MGKPRNNLYPCDTMTIRLGKGQFSDKPILYNKLINQSWNNTWGNYGVSIGDLFGSTSRTRVTRGKMTSPYLRLFKSSHPMVAKPRGFLNLQQLWTVLQLRCFQHIDLNLNPQSMANSRLS